MRIINCCLALLSFSFSLVFCSYVSADPEIPWHTFLGSVGLDTGFSVTADASGNIYVAGNSETTWGSPINDHAGSDDAFVAKMNSSGVLQWHSFLGSASTDKGYAVAADTSGNIYITGYSNDTWGSPINAYAGGQDAFVAKLDSSGVLQWHSFLGSAGSDNGHSVTADASGNIYVIGHSDETWGFPIKAYTGGRDAFVAKLDSSGVLQWHTFLGSTSTDDGISLAADASGSIYVTGHSNDSWGLPIRAYAGGGDAFVAKLDSSGILQWHTFFGSSSSDGGISLAADASGNIYVTGRSYDSWGSPINAHTGGHDAFIAKFDNSGVLQWHTFLGSGNTDEGESVAVDATGNLYVSGSSTAAWGSPIIAHAGGYNAFAAKLDSGGVLQWHAFFGSGIGEWGYSIAVDTGGNIYITGNANAGWGSPLDAHAGDLDAFVAKIHDLDIDDDGCLNDADGCPYDIYKCGPGVCGCGETETDSDNDGFPNCNDNCPTDPNKTDPGACGCGILDTDTDTDSIPDCIDTDDDGDGTDDSADAFPIDADETADTDQDGTGNNGDSDDDNDGIDDSMETAGPANGDGNGDGIADSLQNHVTTLAVLNGQQFCTLELAVGHRFVQSQAVDRPPADGTPDGVDFEYGYFDFTSAGIGMGQSTTVTLYLPAGAAPTTYYKYGKTPDNPGDHWYEFLYDGQTGAEINGNVITLHFVDGQRGDDILTTDGMVIDIGGPGFESTAADNSGSGGGGCFINCLRW